MVYRCSFAHCQKCFSTRFNLKRHEDAFHLRLRPFTCPECFRDFASKQNLAEHGFIHRRYGVVLGNIPSGLEVCRDIQIPKLTDMVKMTDDIDLRPGIVVRRIYPYSVPFCPPTTRKAAGRNQ